MLPAGERVLTAHIRAAMQRARYDKLGDGALYGEIPGLDGVWAEADTLEATRDELQEVLEEWLLLGLRLGHALPVIEGIDPAPAQDAV
jgi:predicted RNase H-like HicB family nuclease